MKIKDQILYTELFFKRPQRVLDILNYNMIHFQNQADYVELFLSECPEVYTLPLESNFGELSKIMDVKKYLEKSKDEYDDSGIDGNISLIKLFADFNYEFNVNIKVDEDFFIIYVDEKEFKDLFEITYQTELSRDTLAI